MTTGKRRPPGSLITGALLCASGLAAQMALSSCGAPQAPDAERETEVSGGTAEPAPPAAGPTAVVGGVGSCREQLDRVATCFYASVSLLQAEPGPEESLGQFLGRAAAAGDDQWRSTCADLGLGPETTRLLLAGGGEVTFRHDDVSHDSLEGGVSTLHIQYTFSASSCPDEGVTTIELTVGGE